MVATPAAGIATIRIPPMAMPQWDDLIEEIKRTKLSLGGKFFRQIRKQLPGDARIWYNSRTNTKEKTEKRNK